MDPVTRDILTFWFGTTDMQADIEKRDIWFKSTPEFDAALIENFTEIHERAAAGALDHLRDTPEGCLSLIISLDQFPRNIYRGSGKAFHTDALACALSHHALALQFDSAISLEPRKFFYLPLVHSETLSDQQIAVEKYRAFDDEKSLISAIGHHDAIERFGRFPHRNKVLGRVSTPEEEEYLQIPPTWGMTAAEAAERDRMVAEQDAAAS
tara:strand:- start:988 stop:1617 length:630 start_codon:yes stop_codon:yes gene_type:complete